MREHFQNLILFWTVDCVEIFQRVSDKTVRIHSVTSFSGIPFGFRSMFGWGGPRTKMNEGDEISKRKKHTLLRTHTYCVRRNCANITRRKGEAEPTEDAQKYPSGRLRRQKSREIRWNSLPVISHHYYNKWREMWKVANFQMWVCFTIRSNICGSWTTFLKVRQ